MLPKRFSDFAEEEKLLEGPKVKVESILNQEITITGYNIKKSKYNKNNSGKCLMIQFENNQAEKKVFFTGSGVLIDQMGKYGHEIPFVTTVKKIDRYYTFS